MLNYRPGRSDRTYSLLEQLIDAARNHLASDLAPAQQTAMIRLEVQRLFPMLRKDDCERVLEYVLERLGGTVSSPEAPSGQVIRFPLERRL